MPIAIRVGRSKVGVPGWSTLSTAHAGRTANAVMQAQRVSFWKGVIASLVLSAATYSLGNSELPLIRRPLLGQGNAPFAGIEIRLSCHFCYSDRRWHGSL